MFRYILETSMSTVTENKNWFIKKRGGIEKVGWDTTVSLSKRTLQILIKKQAPKWHQSILSKKQWNILKIFPKTIEAQKDVNLMRCQINSFNILIFPYHCTETIYFSCSLS